jgi:hypothetical protein
MTVNRKVIHILGHAFYPAKSRTADIDVNFGSVKACVPNHIPQLRWESAVEHRGILVVACGVGEVSASQQMPSIHAQLGKARAWHIGLCCDELSGRFEWLRGVREKESCCLYSSVMAGPRG